MIYVTGDIHGDPISRLNTASFYEQKEMSDTDYVIVAGDFGVIWDNIPEGKKETHLLKWLDEKPFTTLFVDGNHENFNRLDAYPPTPFSGGFAHQISEKVWHLPRGEMFTIDNKKIFTMGGAKSHDIRDGILDPADFPDNKAFVKEYKRWQREMRSFRIRNMSWWDAEMPSRQDYEKAENTLNDNKWRADFVISHCAPQHVAIALGGAGLYEADEMTLWLNKISERLKFRRWIFGHYHEDRQVLGDYIAIYRQIIRIA